MGDHQDARRRIHRRRRRARARRAHAVRGRRRQAVDLLVPGRGAAKHSTRCGGYSSAHIDDAGLALARSCASITRSARRRWCSARSTRCSAARPQSRGVTTDPAGRYSTSRARRGAGLVEIWPLVEPDEKTRSRGLGCAVRHRERNEPARCSLRARSRAQAWSSAAIAATGTRSRRGDVLILVRQRGPLFEAIIRALKTCGHRRSPAPTGWC